MKTISIPDEYKKALTAYANQEPDSVGSPPPSPVIVQVDLIAPAAENAQVRTGLNLGKEYLVVPRKEAEARDLKVIAASRRVPPPLPVIAPAEHQGEAEAPLPADQEGAAGPVAPQEAAATADVDDHPAPTEEDRHEPDQAAPPAADTSPAPAATASKARSPSRQNRVAFGAGVHHVGLGFLQPKTIKEHGAPPKLTEEATPQFAVVSPAQCKVTLAPSATPRIYKTWDGQHVLEGRIRLKFSITSWVAFDVTDAKSKDHLIQRFPSHTDKSGKVFIDVKMNELRPSDVNESWFTELAFGLQQVSVLAQVYAQRKGADGLYAYRRVNPHTGIHSHGCMSALTAAALAMKAYGDIEAMTKVISFAPGQVASEMYAQKLGEAFGTQAVRCLLNCLLENAKKSNYATSDKNLLTAGAVIVAQLHRDDHHEAVHALPKNIEKKLAELVDLSFSGDPNNVESYLKMAGAREGIRFGAMKAFANLADEHTQQHVDTINAYAEAVVGILSAGVAVANSQAGSGLGEGKGIAKVHVMRWFDKRWKKDEAGNIINDNFKASVERESARGNIKGLKHALDCTKAPFKGLLENCAKDAEVIMNIIGAVVPHNLRKLD